MGKSHDIATFLDDGSSGDLIVNSGHQLQVKRSDGLAFGTISKGNTTDALGSGIIYNDVSSDGHHFKLGGVTKMNIDASGRVTMPYQPAFAAKGTSYTQVAGASTVTTATTYLNVGNHYNGTTFTAPVSGNYVFSFWGLSYPHSESTVCSVNFRVNGTMYGHNMQFGGDSTNHRGIAGCQVISLNTNDAVTFIYNSGGSGAAKAYSNQWNYSGYLIG